MGSFDSRTNFLFFLLVLLCFNVVSAEESCFGAGAIATSVVLSVVVTLLIIGAIFYWISRRTRPDQLILETDPEKGKAEYAFDNPGFKDAGFTPISKAAETSNPKIESENSRKEKWNHWPRLAALANKTEKRNKTLDDSVIRSNEVKVVALKSHDFTGLGFGICGNMKEGIFIKDILMKGPASESGKLNIGDRINSVTISFEHMVYEDALSILSYASPYEIIIEAKTAGAQIGSSTKGSYPIHPIYRSSSSTDLQQVEKSSRRKLYSETSFGSNNSTLHKSISNMTTLERKESKSPKPYHNIFTKNAQNNSLNSEQLRNQLEQRITSVETEARLKNEPVRVETASQKSENRHQKFGIKVFPTQEQRSPKTNELSNNDNNVNIEKNTKTNHVIVGIDEVDESDGNNKTSIQEKLDETFKRNGSLNGSGLKRDSNGIPQEIPCHMFNAAVAARRNRKGNEEPTITTEEDSKFPKKLKGKAPPPPDEKPSKATNLQENNTPSPKPTENLDEIKQIDEDFCDVKKHPTINGSSTKSSLKEFNSDSEEETDNHSSVNTIELNSSDITIHHEENEEKQNRKTASTGDLSKIHKTRKSSTGTLERAQSLDITDSGIPTLKRKAGRLEDAYDINSTDEDNIFGKAMINKEPRLSLILDGLNTFQRNRLKKSTEWGNLEDAILRSSPENNQKVMFEEKEKMNFDFGDKSAEFSALVNRINEIRRESQDVEKIEDGKETAKNEIWPSQIDEPVEIKVAPPREIKQNLLPVNVSSNAVPAKANGTVKNEIWPKELEDVKYKNIEPPEETSEDRKIIGEKIHDGEKSDAIIDKEEPKDEKTKLITIEDIIKSLPVELMLESETPPDAIATEPKPKVSNHSTKRETNIDQYKIHKRQQIPISIHEELIPPPQIIENNLEDEIFEQLRKNQSTNSDIETLKVASTTNNSIVSTSKAPKDLKRNSETGEICSVIQNNGTDESKTVSLTEHATTGVDTQDFILRERYSYEQSMPYQVMPEDINISDDIKVSRTSLGSLEMPKSDDAKSIESIKYCSNVVTINSVQTENGSSSLHSLEFSINQEPQPIVTTAEESNHSMLSSNEDGELYTTALNKTENNTSTSKITISTPDLIKNVTITEAINTLNNDMDLNLENLKDASRMTNGTINNNGHSSLTYITEIQVTPNNGTINKNVSEIEILPTVNNEENTNIKSFETFDSYVKTFEVKNDENGLETEKKPQEPIIVQNPEKQLHKIQEIAQEQLKKLPEMRFSTSSYETTTKIPEKRQSQVELLKSNFEKNSPKKTDTLTKSRIPISATMKTPPTSPERRDSRNLDVENEGEILELMSSAVHSTPMTTQINNQLLKYNNQKSPNKNVTVTSIRSNSKIPSGLPILAGNRPPVPKKPEQENGTSIVQVSSGGTINSFKQWVFDPVDSVGATDHNK